MAILEWNVPALKFFENGVSRPVLFAHDPVTDIPTAGVAWEGLVGVTEKPTGAEVTKLWANNLEYSQLVSMEELEGTIEAYTYPEELNPAMGIVQPSGPGLLMPMQNRTRFSLAYQTRIHSDGGGHDVGYLIHILYNLRMKPSERANMTVNESPEAQTFSWDFTSTPAEVAGTEFKPVAKIVIDSRTADAGDLLAVEHALYGTELLDPELLTPADLIAMFVVGP